MFWDSTDQQKKKTPHVSASGLTLVILLGAILLTATTAFIAGYVAAGGAKGDKLALFNEVWDQIDRNFYYPKPAETERVYGAINGMISTLNDRHTMFLPPEPASADAALMGGETGGVGVIVTQNTENNQITIVEVRRGWPADSAGVKAGDVIVAVNDVDVAKKTLSDVSSMIRGPLNTQVKITLRRPAKEGVIEVTLKRTQINVYGTMLDGNIAYISFSIFDKTSPDNIARILDDLLPKKPIGLIIDVRNNGGGLLDAAVKISDLFLPEGLILTEKAVGTEEKKFNSKTGEAGEQIPIVVLVNRNSASASEILAGAIQDRKRGILIGERTFGKGSVQGVYTLSDGSQLRVTVGAWYTPNNTPIESHSNQPGGLRPNIEVPTPEQPGSDPQLDKAIEYLTDLVKNNKVL